MRGSAKRYRWLSLLVLAGLALSARAGILSRKDVARWFPPPLHVGERLTDVPAWPLTSELKPEAGPVAYAFESVDIAPIPGFEGTPFDLLIAIDAKGNFLSVDVLRQHEPVFLSGLGVKPLLAFVKQYAGLNVRQNITVASSYRERGAGPAGSGWVALDGVTKATASIHIVNRTVLTAALAVARARLGLFEPVRKGPVARVRTDLYRPENFAALLRDGYLVHRRWTNAQVEVLFRGTAAQGLDPQAARDPDGTYVDLYVGYANAPTIGRALLGDAAWKDMMGNLQPGQAAYWVATAGRDPLVGPTFVRGTPPPRLTLSQGGEPLEAKDADAELRPVPGGPTFRRMLVIQTPAMAAVDPSGTMTFTLRLVRKKGQMFPTVVEKSVSLAYTPPAGLFFRPAAPLPEWLADWIAHWPQLATIAAALVLLSAVLARPRGVSVHAGRMNAFRLGYLAWTLVYLGWYAQGQLSIVQLTGAVKTLRAGQGLGSFLYDPVSLLLIVFTLVSFVAWGRGTFCGWLCPFGAMQEFVGVLARRLGVRRRRLPSRLETFLERGRYGLLAGLLVAAAFAPHLAERLVEVEPFKTAITVGFDRSWPYVAWAALLLALGAAYYKFFCRFLCPLGAAITLGGKLRLFDWLPRRRECGKPCQTCRARCEYDAIARDGRILYDRCFQCLDCVGVYHDPGRCAPLLFHARTGRNFRRPHEPVLPPPRRAGA